MKYPKTPTGPVREIIHGKEIVDNYRWLEDDNSKRVKEWIKAQNENVIENIENDKKYNVYKNRILSELATDYESVPGFRNGRYFYYAQKADQDRSVLYYKDGLGGKPIQIIDPNELSEKENKSISIYFSSPSTTGRYIGYGLIVDGHEIVDLVILDLDTNKKICVLPYHRDGLTWMPDDSGFYHIQYPDPSTVPEGEACYHSKLNYFNLETLADKKVFGDGFHKETMFSCDISLDGKQIIVSTTRGWKSNDLYVASTDENAFRPLVVGIDATFSACQLDRQVIIATDYMAPNRRVLMAKLDCIPNSIEDWVEIIPEANDVLSNWGASKKYIAVEYCHNASSKLKLFDYGGRYVSNLDLPELSSLNGLSMSCREEEFFFSYCNFLQSETICRYNPENSNVEVYRQPQRSLDPEIYEARQEWYESKDGTKVPMFIIGKKDLQLDGSNKAILYGYGGFGSSEVPVFMTSRIPFFENGGVFAIANIRGGNEFGKTWHEGGVRKNKMNSYDDFIAAAEYLIEKGYTNSEHLAIRGGSNGGLLVAACMALRPKLFGAIICHVPLIDMVRFPKFLMASRWTEEYGNPDKKAGLDRILKWSPYHNIKANIDYPAVYIETGVNDSRVAPLHSRKLAAILQAGKKSKPIYLYTDMKSGHGSGGGRLRAAEMHAREMVFMDHNI